MAETGTPSTAVKRGASGAGDSGAGGAAKRPRAAACPQMAQARRFLDQLGLSSFYFDDNYDRCYCETCAARIPAVLETDRVDGNYYEVPKGVAFPAPADPQNV